MRHHVNWIVEVENALESDRFTDQPVNLASTSLHSRSSKPFARSSLRLRHGGDNYEHRVNHFRVEINDH